MGNRSFIDWCYERREHSKALMRWGDAINGPSPLKMSPPSHSVEHPHTCHRQVRKHGGRGGGVRKIASRKESQKVRSDSRSTERMT